MRLMPLAEFTKEEKKSGQAGFVPFFAPPPEEKKEEIETVAAVEENPQETERPPEPEEVFVSQSEMEIARKLSFEEGFKAGSEFVNSQKNTEQQETEKRVAEMLAALKDEIVASQQSFAKSLDGKAAETSRLAMSVARKVAREALTQFPDLDVAAAVREALRNIASEPKASVRLNPSVAARLEQAMGQMAEGAGFKGEIKIIPDEFYQAADCKIEWDKGESERKTGNIWQSIEEIINRINVNPGSKQA